MHSTALFCILSSFFLLFSVSQPHIRRPLHKRSITISPFVDISSVTEHSPLKLTRIQTVNPSNAHLHPQLIHQQHLNRANKRHAIMSNSSIPSEEELSLKLRKRLNSVELVGNSRKLRKRYRMGKAAAGMKNYGDAPRTNVLIDAATSKSAGVSQVDENAATKNTVQLPTNPTGTNSLGLAIEANDVGEHFSFISKDESILTSLIQDISQRFK